MTGEKSEAVSVDELQAWAEKWREIYEKEREERLNDMIYKPCADDLERLIDTHSTEQSRPR